MEALIHQFIMSDFLSSDFIILFIISKYYTIRNGVNYYYFLRDRWKCLLIKCIQQGEN